MTRFFFIAVLIGLLAACGGDEVDPENNGMDCPVGQQYDPILQQCARVDDRPDETGDDASDAETTPDAGTDADDEEVDQGPDLLCQTDSDGDGALAMECGGDDCDDTDERRFPGAGEVCDEVDNDCDEELNEELDCTVYAHSDSRLYLLDFFAGTFEDLGPTVANLYDIDTHPDGTLYGIAGNYLQVYDPASQTWTEADQALAFAEVVNGFCIDNDGEAFATTNSTLRSVDLATGASTRIGSLAPTSSSGDCVVNKGNVLFMSSNHTTPDSFARIDGDTGTATVVGQTDYDGIWGLTAAYNRVFGMTDEGHVVEIDVGDGSTSLIHTYPQLSFYGAASTPGR